MSNDIGRYGENPDLGHYWIQEEPSPGNKRLSLIVIDQFGEVTQTGVMAPHDAAALTQSEAIGHHLRGAIRQADSDLDRRRKEYAENPPDPDPEPMDLATAKFHSSVW